MQLLNLKCYLSRIDKDSYERIKALEDIGVTPKDSEYGEEMVISNILLNPNDISYSINTSDNNNCTIVLKNGHSIVIADKEEFLLKIGKVIKII